MAGCGHIDVIRLILVGLVVIGGCSNTPNSEETYIGWHCEESDRQGGVKCEQGLMTQGQPIAAALEDKPLKTQASDQPPVQKKPLEIIWIGKNRPKPWRDQLPGFTLDESTEAYIPKTSPHADQSTPEPEAGFIDDLDKSSSDIVGGPPVTKNNKIMTDTIVNDASEQAAKSEITGENPSALLGGDVNQRAGFTIQLGAFATAQAAQQFLRDNNLFHLNIAKQQRESAGKDWHVLTFGYFTEKKAAQKAWLEAAENSADIDVWIRPVSQ